MVGGCKPVTAEEVSVGPEDDFGESVDFFVGLGVEDFALTVVSGALVDRGFGGALVV